MKICRKKSISQRDFQTMQSNINVKTKMVSTPFLPVHVGRGAQVKSFEPQKEVKHHMPLTLRRDPFYFLTVQ